MNPIFVAIDTPDLARAKELAQAAAPHVGGLKLGLEFFAANGPGGVEALGSAGLPIFLDLKLHDIPNTVAKAVEALRALRPAVLTVHAAGGHAMLAAAKAAAPAETKVVAVTVLTSLEAADLHELGYRDSSVEDIVLYRARKALDAGADGVIASGQEAEAIGHLTAGKLKIVTPGIRRGSDALGDQKRVATPASAIEAGADYLVVGRPVSQAEDPRREAEAIVGEIEAAIQNR